MPQGIKVPMAQNVSREVQDEIMGATKAELADLVVDLLRASVGADADGEELLSAYREAREPVAALRERFGREVRARFGR